MSIVPTDHVIQPGQPFEVEFDLPLGAGVGLWTPDSRGHRTLPPDWAQRTTTSLVQSAPVVVLHDAAGTALWGIACSEIVGQVTVRGGVSEEHKSVRLWFSVAASPSQRTLTIGRIDRPAALASTIAELADWLDRTQQVSPMPRPAAATEPVFSTWYTYTQDVNHDNVLAEGRLAAELGCGTMFIDDGWQVGGHGRGYAMCGQWTPDTDKFPDLRTTVDDLRALGLDTVIWVAPLLLGMDSPLVETMGRFAPEGNERDRMWTLDPRHREVRDFVADTCARIVADFGVAGLKIDFLNNAMAYAGTPSTGDVDDVGEAMRQMLAQVRWRLAEVGLPAPIMEFRQPYVSPAITAFGNCIRVGDCPADAVVNRQGSLDLRLFLSSATADTGAVVHADPLMWARDGGAVAVAQQFQSTFFSVPQVSMPLASLDEEQRASVAHHLALWRAWRDVALFGGLRVEGSELGYTQAVASLGGRAVAAVFRPELLDLTGVDAQSLLVLNASPRAGVHLVGSDDWRVESVTTASGAEADPSAPVPAYGAVVFTRR